MQGNEYALLQLFADGGAMMYPLVLASLLALGIIIAKAYTLWVAHRESEELLERVEALGREGRIDEAIELADSTPGPVAAVLHSGLSRVREHRTSGRDIEQAIQTTGSIELGFLERGLTALATVSNVAPLMGFLGTVAGMIIAFGKIAEVGQVDATLVAGGIKIALITTAAGLIIAVPVNIAYNYFVSRIDRLIVDMEKGTTAVLDMIWDWQAQGLVPHHEGTGTATPAAAVSHVGDTAAPLHDTQPEKRTLDEDPTDEVIGSESER